MTTIEQLCEWSDPMGASPRQREAVKTLTDCMKLVSSTFSPALLEELMDAQTEVQQVMTEEAFVRGFRLGVNLVIEGVQTSIV